MSSMTEYKFRSDFNVGAKMRNWDQDYVKNEPMLFSCTPLNAWNKGGPITREFLALFFGITLADEAAWVLRDSKKSNYCFDSRVHMLMPGWWPCIPGWHHDDVPRSRWDGQPNYANPEYSSNHCLALVNGDICPTEFAVGDFVMPHVEGTVYGMWDRIVEDELQEGMHRRVSVPSNQLIHFDCNSFHRGTQAVGRGFRWFGRLSWNAGYEQGRPHHNEVRQQVNVYMDMPNAGW